MGGCNCGADKSVKPINEIVEKNMAAMRHGTQEEISKMEDNDMILVDYKHANRGQHVVKGAVTGTNYGYRGGGSRFLVHKADIARSPHIFVPVESQQAKVNEPAPRPAQEFDAEQYLAKIRSKWSRDLDLQSLPGVNAQIELGMKSSGFTTRDAILRTGAEGLSGAVKGLGQIKAEAIIAYLESVDAD